MILTGVEVSLLTAATKRNWNGIGVRLCVFFDLFRIVLLCLVYHTTPLVVFALAQRYAFAVS